MKFCIESSTLRFEKYYPTKTDDDFFHIDDDIFETFVDNIENKYNTTLDFHGENDLNQYTLVDNNLTEVEHQNLFKEFTDFLDVNL